jgi:hypothetical protein
MVDPNKALVPSPQPPLFKEVRGFVLSWRGAPPQYHEHSIWDRVGFYTMHTFLNSLVESQFESFPKLIIPIRHHI